MPAQTQRTPQRWGGWWSQLWVQVLIGIAVGAALGYLQPKYGAEMKPLGDAFIKLIKMLLAPIIFGTVVLGIARMGDIKEAGRVGAKALIYFEAVSTMALVIGMVIANLFTPGAGMNMDPHTVDTRSIAAYTQAAQHQDGIVAFLMNIIPNTIVDAFAKGNILQVILFAVLFGIGLSQVKGERPRLFLDALDTFLNGLFNVVGLVMRLAPIGAFAGMAFTVGAYGIGSLLALGDLVLCTFVTAALFVFIVLAGICRANGFPLLKFLRYIKEEILIVFGTCSTEAVLPQMLEKLENMGCERTVVGMVLPAGYTFNADGSSIYLTMAALFIAQATNTPLTLTDQLVVLGVLLLTSKGSAGVAGATFVTLAATLASLDKVPVAGLVLLLGVERFVNIPRAVVNLIGNGVATMVVARWEKAFDAERAARVLNGEAPVAGETMARTAPGGVAE